MEKLQFTGHETFHCRNYWLKKGLDHIWQGKGFGEDAVVDLGVGRNMVSSIRFWLRAFDLVDDNDIPNEVAHFLFNDSEGVDPYCEDQATLWLLHYYLTTSKRSSIYHYVFNVFRKQRVEFTEKHLVDFLENVVNQSDDYVHPSSVKKDVKVFINNYTLPAKRKGVEDDFSRLLYELGLVKKLDNRGEWYRIENQARKDIPYQIVLFCIRENKDYSDIINLKQLATDIDSVGSVFALSEHGLMEKIEQIVTNHPKEVVFTDDGGVRILQFKQPIDHWKILKAYYGR